MNDKKTRINPRCTFASRLYYVMSVSHTVQLQLGNLQVTIHYAHNQTSPNKAVLSSCNDSHRIKSLAL